MGEVGGSLSRYSSLSRYFALLDDGDADGCAALFAPDAVCIRQALGPDGSLLPGVDVLRGRDAIHGYVRGRGIRPYRHSIRHEIADGTAICVEGIVRAADATPTSLFLATAELDLSGRFQRYLAIGTPVTGEV
jgi:ketosteroid isomerase-like protein